MTVKLNLTIDEVTAKKIKQLAARNNTSVSKIAEEQFRKLTDKATQKSFVEKYAGILKNSIPDIDKAKEEYLNGKYGQ